MAARFDCKQPARRLASRSPPPRTVWFCLVLALMPVVGAESEQLASENPDAMRQRSYPSSTERTGDSLTSFSLPSISTPGYWLHMDTDLSVSRDSLATHWSAVVRTPDREPDYSLSNPAALERWNRLNRSPAMIEIYPSHLLASEPQAVYRPQFALGGSSESLRSWLRGAGLNASSCMAPLMKMHSTIAGAGPRTNVSVSARCSFH